MEAQRGKADETEDHPSGETRARWRNDSGREAYWAAWREENAAAIESWNAWVEEHGLPLERYRTF